jgi:hypothetical protein
MTYGRKAATSSRRKAAASRIPSTRAAYVHAVEWPRTREERRCDASSW